MKRNIRSKTKDITPEELYLDQEGEGTSYVAGKQFSPVVMVFGVLALCLIGLLWTYTFRLQALSSDSQANLSYTKTYIEPRRGHIFGSNGTLLASTAPSFDVVIFPKNLPQKKNKLISTLAKNLSLSEENIRDIIQAKSDQKKFILAEEISRENAIRLETKNSFKGVVLKKRQERNYKHPRLFAHIIGYIGKLSQSQRKQYENYLLNDTIGKSGIEQTYEEHLHGEYGIRDPLNPNKIRKQPVPGQSLELTVDTEFQQATHTKVKEIIEGNDQIHKGIAIAMNPQNGEILSLVSFPSFNANEFIGGISQEKYSQLQEDKGNPLLNKAIKGAYHPGSTVKPLLAGAMLQEDIITTQTEINDPDGKLIVPNPYDPNNPTVFPDWKVHGRSDVYKAIADSVNVFFYTFGGGTPDRTGLGIKRIVDYYQRFGFGTPTGIELPGEKKGNMPYTSLSSKEQKRWTRGDTYNVSIGQGTLTTTPLQINTYISAIANGGTLFSPQLVDKAFNFDKTSLEKDFSAKVVRKDLLNPKDMKTVQKGMRQTVTDGTGEQLQNLSYKTAAKSGTAQTSNERNNSWFTAYGPYKNPEIAVTVLVVEGDDSGETAVPIAKHMLKWYKENRDFTKKR